MHTHKNTQTHKHTKTHTQTNKQTNNKQTESLTDWCFDREIRILQIRVQYLNTILKMVESK